MDDGADDPGAQKMTRRRIYLQRLIGDDLWGGHKILGRRASIKRIFRFMVYLTIASVVIMTRVNISDIYEINSGLEQTLVRTGVVVGSSVMYFDDIRSRDDVMLWVDRVLFGSILGDANGSSFRKNLTLLSFNRVTPSEGVCTEAASVLLTLRRTEVSTNVVPFVTDRFKVLYPRMWRVDSIAAGTTNGADGEGKDTLVGANGNYTWAHTTSGRGFQQQGGYLATATLLQNGEAFVHLMDYGVNAIVNNKTAEGACFGIPSSSTMTPKMFWQQGFFDSSFSSLAVEFLAYNANLQTMSHVQVVFDANSAGMITLKDIRTDTLRLDVYSNTMRYFEVIYLCATILYFFAFVHAGARSIRSYFMNVWTWVNGTSISMSFLSLFLWFAYEPMLESYLVDGQFRDISAFQRLFIFFSSYRRASAAATLMIFLRLVEYLSRSSSRVLLLSRTLKVGAGNMAIYLCYIGVVLLGCAAFAQTYFSSFSVEFVSPTTSFLNCFNLFFGDIDSLKSVDESAAVLKNWFYLPFMIFFYIVSVQMFNAIINYSYNLVSEEMDPQFEHERLERKRHRALDHSSTTVGQWAMFAREKLAHFFPFLKSDEVETRASNEDENAIQRAIDELDDESKAKVEAHLQKDEHRNIPDGTFNIILFWIFAACYIWFLAANLHVENNFEIRRAVQRSINNVPTQTKDGTLLNFADIATLPDMAEWTLQALPAVIFNTTSPELKASAIELGLYDDSTVCLRSWNCLVAMVNQEGKSTKLVRVTQRQAVQQVNTGRVDPGTPDRARFVGASGNGVTADASTLLVPTRWAAAIVPTEAPDPATENSTLLEIPRDLVSFCSVASEGDEASFGGYGGVVCLLDADQAKFMSQVDLLSSSGFFTTASSSWVIDFAMQNSNLQILSYVAITVVVTRSGMVVKDYKVDSIKLFSLQLWYENFGSIVLRLLPGIIYTSLTIRFIYNLRGDLLKAWVRDANHGRRKLRSKIVATLHFFRYDIFNALELISILISLFSLVLFVWWMVKDWQLQSLKGSTFTAFLGYCQGLAGQARLYNRLSALNVLIIGVRPLKFVRENARIAALMRVLWESSQDLRWFVVMLFVTMSGFVMLAHISFGSMVPDCSSLTSTLVYCFRFLLGDFDYSTILAVDPLMAAFMFPYLIIMYCVFTNIFFAIIDRHFVTIDPPAFQWKQKLKPLLGRCFRCINWDEDFEMEPDPNAAKKKGPDSRRERVKQTVKEIQKIKENVSSSSSSAFDRKAFNLQEVCDVDAKLQEVWNWGQDEARSLKKTLDSLIAKKMKSNEESFVRREVDDFLAEGLKSSKEEMQEASRQMRYACKVDEQVAVRDQETLSTYACILEQRVCKLSLSKDSLQMVVQKLKDENEKMCIESTASKVAGQSIEAKPLSEREAAPKVSDTSGQRPESGQPSTSDASRTKPTSATHEHSEMHAHTAGANQDPTAPMALSSAHGQAAEAAKIRQALTSAVGKQRHNP